MRRFTFDSPIGCWEVTATDEGLVSLDHMGEDSLPTSAASPETSMEREAAQLLARYFDRQPVDFAGLPIDWSAVAASRGASRFRLRLWRALARVPYGKTVSYAELGEAAGFAKASRAVGQAMGHNPLPIVVPCHRVIAKDGRLGGFMRGQPGGLSIKRFLLATEGIYISG